ncbi:MAG TPA: AraC family transcriptional regulator [Spirochaetota bacterium]|nr:AraC family transcriptional regulator [Spirochaetota bacterium]
MDNSGHTNIRNPMKKEYVSRINRVIDYIENHLDEPMTLDILAGVAHFSPYHFHRIFSSMVGEPLYKFIQRLRLEKAATSSLLTGTTR